MHLLPGLHLLVKQLFLLLLFRLLLLVSNQVFYHCRLCHVLITLVVVQLLLLHFLLLGIVHVLLYLLAVSPFIVQYFLSLFLLLSFMQQSYLGFFIHFHLVPELLLALVLHVSSALIDDVACLFPGLFNLLKCSVLLLFEQGNTICE